MSLRDDGEWWIVEKVCVLMMIVWCVSVGGVCEYCGVMIEDVTRAL